MLIIIGVIAITTVVFIVIAFFYIRKRILRVRKGAHAPLIIIPNGFDAKSDSEWSFNNSPFSIRIAEGNTNDDIEQYLAKNDVGEIYDQTKHNWHVRKTPHGGWRFCGLDLTQLNVGDLLLSTEISVDEEKSLIHDLLYDVFGEECRADIDKMRKPWKPIIAMNPTIRTFYNMKRNSHSRNWIRNIVTGDVPTHAAIVGQKRGDGTQPEDFTVYDFTASTGKRQTILSDYLETLPSTKSRLWVVQLHKSKNNDKSSAQRNDIHGNLNSCQITTDHIKISNERANQSFSTIENDSGIRSFWRYGQTRLEEDNDIGWHGLNSTNLSCAGMSYALLDAWCFVSHKDDPTPNSDLYSHTGIQKRKKHPLSILPSDFIRRDFQWSQGVNIKCIRRVLWVRKGLL